MNEMVKLGAKILGVLVIVYLVCCVICAALQSVVWVVISVVMLTIVSGFLLYFWYDESRLYVLTERLSDPLSFLASWQIYGYRILTKKEVPHQIGDSTCVEFLIDIRDVATNVEICDVCTTHELYDKLKVGEVFLPKPPETQPASPVDASAAN